MEGEIFLLKKGEYQVFSLAKDFLRLFLEEIFHLPFA
jgi:hypothetical protein